ncbi:Ferredoxin-related [Hibiscus syriacus]|uniref:Ferredoxin-related n=1 Tax=Hibiscus syriacus TaxID=106335 RepID=A0A6A2ZYW5_HIBSY|nr:Ferredoxin-related [Hibiscus syriacus]
MLILSITLIVSVSLCLLLRHLNRRCLRSHLSFLDFYYPRLRFQSPCQSGEIADGFVARSLPLFTFSSITRRSSNAVPLCCHAFHAHCIDTWLASNQTCPLCRSPLFTSESDLIKSLLKSSNAAGPIGNCGRDSFRLEIGSVSPTTARLGISGKAGRFFTGSSRRSDIAGPSAVIMTWKPIASARKSAKCFVGSQGVSSCSNEKEIWDKLRVTHEGTDEVRETNISLLNHNYENFKMKPDEDIKAMTYRFFVIVNDLKGFGEVISNEKLVRKMIYALPKSWQSKKTTIIES